MIGRGTEELEQSNPILYIFVGAIDGEIIAEISDIHRTRMGSKGIGYITVANSEEEKGLAGTIRINHFRFIKKKYGTLGVIKVYYVVMASSAISEQLGNIKSNVEACLQALYPAGVSSVVFLLADNTPRTDWDGVGCGKAIRLVEGLHDDFCLTYLLTNVNSKNILAEDSSVAIARAIAFYALLKDFSTQYAGDSSMLWNRQRFFIEDCLRTGKRLMSIGHSRISRPKMLIENVLLLLLLEHKTEDTELEAAFDYDFLKAAKDVVLRLNVASADDLIGLGVNASSEHVSWKGLTRGHIITERFGDGLSLFFDKMMEDCHIAVEEEKRSMETQLRKKLGELSGENGIGFYNIKLWLTNLRDQSLNNLRDEAARELELLNSRRDGWLVGQVVKGSRRRLSLLRRMDDTAYKIAEKYLAYCCKAKAYEVAEIIIGRAIEIVDELDERYSSTEELLRAEINQIAHETEIAAQQAEDIFTYDAVRQYYGKLLNKYLQEMPDGLTKIYAQMYSYAELNNFEDYIALLRRYISSDILHNPLFYEPLHQLAVNILMQTNHIKAQDEGYNSLLKRILEQRTVQAMLKTGDAGLCNEVNIIADSQAADKLSRADISGNEKVNLFYIDGYDDIDIIYHTGAFNSEELYYADL